MKKIRPARLIPMGVRSTIACLLFLSFLFSAYGKDPGQQEKSQKFLTVHGRVTDESGNPLSGATIQVKGSSRQTLTDDKGFFALDQVDPTAVLVISYVGYTSKEIAVRNNTELNITLQDSGNNLNQVVVIGYGVAKKKDVVGAVSIISAKDAGANTATSASQLLIGKAAGVQVVQTSGLPGSGAQNIKRGTASFTSVHPCTVIA